MISKTINPTTTMTFANGLVTVTPTEGGYVLHTPYHRDFVEDLKLQLPHYARRYNKADKTWWVSEPFLTAAVLDIIGYLVQSHPGHRTRQT